MAATTNGGAPMRHLAALFVAATAVATLASCSDCGHGIAVHCSDDSDCPAGQSCSAGICQRSPATADGAVIIDGNGDARIAPTDAATTDNTRPDAAVPDAISHDATAPDATVPDAARPDATVVDHRLDDSAPATDRSAIDRSAADANFPFCPDGTCNGTETCATCPQDCVGGCFFVGLSGLDTNPGTQERPWRTIQYAADTVNPGDTVNVADGLYDERVLITQSGTAGAKIVFTTNHVADPVNNSSQNAITHGFRIKADHITVSGFEIANTAYRRYDSDVSAGVYILGSYNTVENNYIHDASSNGIYVYASVSNPASSTHNSIRNNKIYHVGQVGVFVHGQYNLIDGNEVSKSQQCHPSIMAVEDIAPDNAGNPNCPYYPAVNGLDADGMRFFGTGHIFRKNYIHDITHGAPGINPAADDYNVNPHIDCFQTWSSAPYFEPSDNIVFEQNLCDNAWPAQSSNETCQGFMIEGDTSSQARTVTNITIRNNIIRAFRGLNINDATSIKVLHNLFIGDLDFNTGFFPSGVGLKNTVDPVVKNNIFYDQNSGSLTIPNSPADNWTNTYLDADLDHNAFYNSDGSTPVCVKINDWVCRTRTASELWGVDPEFVDPITNKFDLQSTSPVIDKGMAISPPDQVTDDYAGNQRPQGTGYDIGAYEYVEGG